MVTALSMLFGAACSTRSDIATMDQARLNECPRSVEGPGELPEQEMFQLDDGRWVVPIENVNEREGMATQAALIFRGAYVQCRSVVIYVEDWQAELVR